MFQPNPSRLRPSLRYLSYSHRCLDATPFKIAIVGSGPAGFYTAHHLLHKSSPKTKLHIDFYERLPAPYGLSRYGVAPDHPEVKNCEEYMDNIMKDYGESSENHAVRFFGNVNIGKDISLQDLQSSYHSVVLSYGCTSADNQLNVPGADSPGVISARQLVNWYNGHPDFYQNNSHFVPPPLDQIEDVTIIGNGNVALDVARILLADPNTHWPSTDITTEALQLLKKSTVKNVNIVARRGVLESAFSNKEIRELFELSKTHNIKFIPLDDSLLTQIDTKSLGRVDKRKVTLIEKYCKAAKQEKVESDDKPEDESSKTWSLQYLKSPAEFIPSTKHPDLLSSTVLSKNLLIHDPLTKRTTVKATEVQETIKNELVVLSIGYKGTPLPGFEELGILFENNKLRNKHGRVLSNDSPADDTELHNSVFKKGWYTSGWIKNGPQGVIATTMMDSFDTADKILEDLSNGIHLNPNSSGDIFDKKSQTIDWSKWLKLNKHELDLGSQTGKTRAKVCDPEDMIKIANK